MAKYYGKIGYAITAETKPGVWTESIVVKNYYGDVIKDTRKNDNSNGVNDNVNISNRISILADPYAYENLQHIVYAEYLGCLWKVNTVDIEYPRLILNLGGVYNEH